MNVELISYTQNAAQLLVYTKSTRLEMGFETRNHIYNKMTNKAIMEELKAMSRTIPSSWEFVDYVFEIKDVTRAFTHQFVRTRTASFAQQSQRVQDVSEMGYETPKGLNPEQQDLFTQAMDNSINSYKALQENEVSLEDARAVLATGMNTNIIAKFNLRTLSDLVGSRLSPRVQGEYRAVLDRMIECVLNVHPWASMFLFPDRMQEGDKLIKMLIKAEEHGVIHVGEFTDLVKAVEKLKAMKKLDDQSDS